MNNQDTYLGVPVEIDSIELVKPDEKKSDTPVDDPVAEKVILDAEESLNNLNDENKDRIIYAITNDKKYQADHKWICIVDKLTSEDILDILNVPLLGKVPEDKGIIDASNTGKPIIPSNR